jgi:hypothetical protein
MKSIKNQPGKLLLILILLSFSNYLSAQLSPSDYHQAIKNGFEQYKTKWELNDAIVMDSSVATVQYFNVYLNNQLDDVSFHSKGSIYFRKFQGFTVYALDSIHTELEIKLTDSPLVGYIVVNREQFETGQALADSVYFKLSEIMQLFQTGWPTYSPPEIATGFKVYFNRAENWGSVIFDEVIADPQITCYDINGKKILLQDIQQISSTQVNFKFPAIKRGIYILVPEAENQVFDSVKFNW